MNEAYDNLQFLIKYSPKYYTKVDFDVSDLHKSKILLKTRTTKIIRAASIQSYSHERKGVVLKALKNKKRYIQQIKGVKQDVVRNFPCINKLVLCVQDYASWRTFLRLTYLESLILESYNLAPGAQLFTNKKTIRYMNWRFWRQFAKLTKLKHVFCHFYNQIDLLLERFLMKLTDMETLLSSLSSLMLHFNYIENPISKEADLTQLYKYTKSLKVHESSSRTLHYFLENLGKFQNLKELSLLKAVDETHRDEQMDLRFLSNLQSLKKLEVLEISFNLSLTKNLQSFLEYFTLPVSIVNIKLNFHEVGLKKISNKELKDHPRSNVFEGNTSFIQFCKNWKNLKNLNSLSLSFIEVENESPLYELHFITPLLKELSCLSSLYYARWCDSDSENKDPIEFSHLWDSITHLKLKMLYIETSAISINNLSFESENNKNFSDNSCLKVLGLCGRVTGDSQNMQNLIGLLDKKAYKSRSTQLEIESLVLETKESFEVFLRGLSRIPRNMIFTINLNMNQICGRDFVNTLSKLASKIPRKRQLKLSFYDIPYVKESFMKRLLQIFEKCNVLHYIKISDQRGRVLYAGTNWYENFIQETSFFAMDADDDELNEIHRNNEENSHDTSNNTLRSLINEENFSHSGSDDGLEQIE